jgi:hypothetical protein
VNISFSCPTAAVNNRDFKIGDSLWVPEDCYADFHNSLHQQLSIYVCAEKPGIDKKELSRLISRSHSHVYRDWVRDNTCNKSLEASAQQLLQEKRQERGISNTNNMRDYQISIREKIARAEIIRVLHGDYHANFESLQKSVLSMYQPIIPSLVSRYDHNEVRETKALLDGSRMVRL